MALITRALQPKQLVPGLNAILGQEYGQRPELWRQIFRSETSDRAYEEEVMTQNFGQAVTKDEGSGITFSQAREVYTASYYNETVALGFEITEEALEDNLYGKLMQRYTRALARSMRETKEVKGHAILNRGFNSSYKGGDGKELFSTAHPMGNGDTFSNYESGSQLAESSLESAINKIGRFKDEAGLFVAARARKLVVPTELQWTAARLLESPYRVATGDNDINVINKISSVPEGSVVSPYLTDTDAWFLLTDIPEGLKHFQRVPMKMKDLPVADSGNMRYRARERYVFGWSDPRCAVAGNV